jgi:hypothetical protein
LLHKASNQGTVVWLPAVDEKHNIVAQDINTLRKTYQGVCGSIRRRRPHAGLDLRRRPKRRRDWLYKSTRLSCETVVHRQASVSFTERTHEESKETAIGRDCIVSQKKTWENIKQRPENHNLEPCSLRMCANMCARTLSGDPRLSAGWPGEACSDAKSKSLRCS